jgi:hypothetical protein
MRAMYRYRLGLALDDHVHTGNSSDGVPAVWPGAPIWCRSGESCARDVYWMNGLAASVAGPLSLPILFVPIPRTGSRDPIRWQRAESGA